MAASKGRRPLIDDDKTAMPGRFRAVDLAALPGQFRAFADETRLQLAAIGQQILPIVNRIEINQQQQSEALRAALAEIVLVRRELAAQGETIALHGARLEKLELLVDQIAKIDRHQKSRKKR